MTKIEADPNVPIIHMVREFGATPEQLFRAHTDPELFQQWIGPDMGTRIDQWEARTGGSYRFASVDANGSEFWFRGCFHEVRPDRIVQTFMYEGDPDGVVLETLWIDDLGGGRSRGRTQALVDSFARRDAFLKVMATGAEEGYAQLDRMVADGAV